MRRHLPWLLPLLILAAVLGGFGIYAASFLLRPAAPPAPAVVVIPAGSSFTETAARLEAAGVITDARRFRLLARFRDDAPRVKAGEYGFEEAATPGRVLDRLVAGDVRRHRVTIPEGFALKEIRTALAAAGFTEVEAFDRLARDGDFLRTLGIEADSLEGYAFPETYSFVAGMQAQKLIRAMVKQLERRLTPEIRAAAAARGMSVHQLLTLASIIQKEAGNREEMPLIAAVFHNRLKLKMPLQADPTVIYGIENFDGNLTRIHLTTTTPYNTYRIPGLPPGPIASPGADALGAAARPAEVDYLYFVACGDGTHVFSTGLPEHNRAVRRYQKAGK